MLGGRYKNEAIERYYAAVPDAQDMTIHVSLGVARDLTHEPHAIVYMLPEPVTLAGEAHDRLDLELYSFDPSLAPAGKSVIKVMLRSRYAYWKALASDHGAYEAEKQTIAETVIAQLERRFPGLSAQVEVADVATPLTTERYTGNYHGYQAWGAPGAGITGIFKGLSKTLPGLSDFYMVGQWALATDRHQHRRHRRAQARARSLQARRPALPDDESLRASTQCPALGGLGGVLSAQARCRALDTPFHFSGGQVREGVKLYRPSYPPAPAPLLLQRVDIPPFCVTIFPQGSVIWHGEPCQMDMQERRV